MMLSALVLALTITLRSAESRPYAMNITADSLTGKSLAEIFDLVSKYDPEAEIEIEMEPVDESPTTPPGINDTVACILENIVVAEFFAGQLNGSLLRSELEELPDGNPDTGVIIPRLFPPLLELFGLAMDGVNNETSWFEFFGRLEGLIDGVGTIRNINPPNTTTTTQTTTTVTATTAAPTTAKTHSSVSIWWSPTAQATSPTGTTNTTPSPTNPTTPWVITAPPTKSTPTSNSPSTTGIAAPLDGKKMVKRGAIPADQVAFADENGNGKGERVSIFNDSLDSLRSSLEALRDC